MVRIILKGSGQISPDDWAVFYETIEINNEDLERKMTGMSVVGAEIVKHLPTSSNSN